VPGATGRAALEKVDLLALFSALKARARQREPLDDQREHVRRPSIASALRERSKETRERTREALQDEEGDEDSASGQTRRDRERARDADIRLGRRRRGERGAEGRARGQDAQGLPGPLDDDDGADADGERSGTQGACVGDDLTPGVDGGEA